MSITTTASLPAPLQAWPDPNADQVSLIARVLAPHIHRARAERRAAEQPPVAPVRRGRVERIAA
ncbi:hypothetical protein [Kitasatospora cineracea]|uniref:hypothetical protein n=1 Tax=Kitasatospora cineracea TaxID=88074 RepID=UPI0037F486FE